MSSKFSSSYFINFWLNIGWKHTIPGPQRLGPLYSILFPKVSLNSPKSIGSGIHFNPKVSKVSPDFTVLHSNDIDSKTLLKLFSFIWQEAPIVLCLLDSKAIVLFIAFFFT